MRTRPSPSVTKASKTDDLQSIPRLASDPSPVSYPLQQPSSSHLFHGGDL